MVRPLLRVAVLGVLVPVLLAAQAPISLDGWDAIDTWPLLEPGRLGDNLTRVPNLRITMDATFPGPSRPPAAMYVDVTRVKFQGRPALWISYLSEGVEPSPTNGTVALDAMAVDRETGRELFRLQAALPPAGTSQAWGGAYDIVQFGPGDLVRTRTAEDGQTRSRRFTVPPVAEFATLGFVLPGLALEPGRRMRIASYTPGGEAVSRDAVRVAGRVPYADAAGGSHEVWAVDLLSSDRSVLIRFFVSEEAPFFYGWTYRLVATGATLTRFQLRRWQRLE